MGEGVLVPDARLVEHEQLTRRHVPEHHLVVKLVNSPKHLSVHLLGIDFLQVCDIYIDSVDLSEQGSLVEDDLLSVRQQLGMVGEVP